MPNTLTERLEGALARAALALPARVQRLLAGGVAVRADGLELAPDVQLLLALLRVAGHRGLDTMSPAEARAEIARAARTIGSPRVSLARVEPRVVAGPAGSIPARLYVPRDDGRRPGLVVYYHGGGWVVGDLDTHDGLCRWLAREADVGVLAVDYRRAPEHRFPAAADDALAAFHSAAAEAEALGFDPGRIAVAGDSAGGNLAAVVARETARAGGARPACQLLIYPVTDLSTKHPSYRLFSTGYFLTEAEMDWYRGHYLPAAAAARDPRASPLLADDLGGLPPAIVVTAGFDVLRDEGEAYARRLREAGVAVRITRHAGLIHGFANAVGASPSALAAMRDVARALRETLDGGAG
jgi:acetyl esterase